MADAVADEVEEEVGVDGVDADGAVVACGGEELAIGTKSHAIDLTLMAAKRPQFLAREYVPQLYCFVRTSGREGFAIRAPRHA